MIQLNKGMQCQRCKQTWIQKDDFSVVKYKTCPSAFNDLFFVLSCWTCYVYSQWCKFFVAPLEWQVFVSTSKKKRSKFWRILVIWHSCTHIGAGRSLMISLHSVCKWMQIPKVHCNLFCQILPLVLAPLSFPWVYLNLVIPVTCDCNGVIPMYFCLRNKPWILLSICLTLIWQSLVECNYNSVNNP